MMRIVFAALAGGLFGLGLLISGMTDTAKVQGFLDWFGAFDPTLMFVMGGAILPMALAWRIARPVSLLGTPTPPRLAQVIDARLLGGSALFGAGWALAGLCPGPALAVLGFGGWDAAIFMAAMLGGMVLARLGHLTFQPA
jgi:uncharacterized membrane protein YedE/YeeE